MKANSGNIVRLRRRQIKPVSKVCAKAFQNSPLMVYYFPNAKERRNNLFYVFEFLIRYGILYGEVYTTSLNLEGVAVWIPSKYAIMTLWRQIRSGAAYLLLLGRVFYRKTQQVEGFTSSIHRSIPFPHWYLSCIAVDPKFQGKGYASILLNTMLTRINKENLPTYLYTNTEKNVAIYKHYGFRVLKETIIPRTEVPFWAMLRKKSTKL